MLWTCKGPCTPVRTTQDDNKQLKRLNVKLNMRAVTRPGLRVKERRRGEEGKDDLEVIERH